MKKLCVFLFVLTVGLFPAWAGDLHYLTEGAPDAVTLLAAPPLPDSREQAADLAEVRSVFHSVSKEEAAIAHSEKRFNAFIFAPTIGTFFKPGKYPQTEAFLKHVQEDADLSCDRAKEHWKRARPYTVDPSLAGGKLETSFSYPSAHSTEAMTLGLVLAELFPEKRDAILAESRLIGWHRVEIARHYATDVYAGRVLAQAVVREMKQNADFQKDFAAAKSEIAGSQRSARLSRPGGN